MNDGDRGRVLLATFSFEYVRPMDSTVRDVLEYNSLSFTVIADKVVLMAFSISTLSPGYMVLGARILPMKRGPLGESKSRLLRTESYFLDKNILLRTLFEASDSLDWAMTARLR